MKVLVTGGREYKDKDRIWAALDLMHSETPITCIVNGGARGVDTLAWQWADSKFEEGVRDGISHAEWYPEWNRFGRKAGHIRNAMMIASKPDRVVAFPGGPGTKNCVQQAVKARIPVWDVEDFWGDLLDLEDMLIAIPIPARV